MEDDILHKLLESRLIAIARGIPNSHIEAAVETLLQGGIRCVEVPFSRQGEIDTLEAIKLLKKTVWRSAASWCRDCYKSQPGRGCRSRWRDLYNFSGLPKRSN